MEQNNWIDEVMESTKGMQKAEPSPFLFEKISSRIAIQKQTIERPAATGIKWALVFTTLIIVTINIVVISDSFVSNSNSTNTDLATQLSTEMGYNTTYNY